MVDFDHLSGTSSPDDSSEMNGIRFETSLAVSPSRSVDSNGLEVVMLTSDQENQMDGSPSPKSNQTVKSLLNADLGIPNTQRSDASIFQAAAAISSRDRDDAIFERQKNQHLMSFISAMGIPVDSVNEFVTSGRLPSSGTAPRSRSRSTADSDLGLGEIPPVIVHDAPGSSPGKATVGSGSTSGSPPSVSTHAMDTGSLPDTPANMPSRSVPALEEGEIPSSSSIPPLIPSSSNSPPNPTPAPPKSWSSILSGKDSSPNLNLSYFPPVFNAGESPVIQPPLAVLQKGMSIWGTCDAPKSINSQPWTRGHVNIHPYIHSFNLI